MRRTLLAGLCSFILCLPLGAAEPQLEGPSLTVYNQKFGVVRQTVPLELKAGVNHVTFSDITATLNLIR